MESSAKKNWSSLTWDDLDEWAGERAVSRGQSYQHKKRVINLALSEEGRLLANVIGGELYVCAVWLDLSRTKGTKIQSLCTCPVGSACKHAVAVVAEYLELMGKNKTVPLSTREDPRWEQLANRNLQPAALDNDDHDMDEGGDESDDAQEKPVRRRGSRQKLDEKIQSHINAKSREELADLVWSLTQRFPELREEFRERIALGEGNVDRLAAEARRELQRLTAEPAWVNSWTGEGRVPDYSRLIHRLERLLESGHPDTVVKLGREIIEHGMDHVGQSNDEGETGEAFAKCFPILFKAVSESSLSPAQKLLFVIDAYLADEYDLIGDAADVVLNNNSEPAAWSEVADKLAQRLATHSTGSLNYQRDQLSGWLANALVSAHRSEEARKVYEQEARKTGSYERLVQFLISHKHYGEAQQWACEGIEKTAEKLPGIASHLAQALSNIARLRRRWEEVAAYEAWQFFDQPSQETFKRLIDAAAKANCQEKVRKFALHFLETGSAPVLTACSTEPNHTSADDAWPLPILEYLRPLMVSAKRHRATGPHYQVLIDMAIAEKNPDDVLRWYDKWSAGRSQQRSNLIGYGWDHYPDLVAEAVAQSHPQRSLEIYHQRVNANLTHAGKSAYEIVVAYLRKMRPIMKAVKREADWSELIADIRARYHNRPRFMEMLNRLDSTTILQTQRARR